MAAAWQILRDERGNAMVEFAFVLPILLTLFIGVVEGTNLLRLERKVVAAAQTAADLITQRRSVNNAELDDILKAAELIFDPFPAAPHSVGVVGVRYDADTGDPEVDWSAGKNGGSIPDAVSLAEGLGAPGEGIVLVRVTYDYSPVFFDFIVDATSIEQTAILRPRRSSFVEGP